MGIKRYHAEHAIWDDDGESYKLVRSTLTQDDDGNLVLFSDHTEMQTGLVEALENPALEEVFQWLIDYPNDEANPDHAAMVRKFRDFVWQARAALSKVRQQ